MAVGLKMQLIKVSLNKTGAQIDSRFLDQPKLLNAESMPGFAMMSCSGFNQLV